MSEHKAAQTAQDAPAMTLAEVQHIAALARLTLRDDEAQRMANDLRAILAYVHKLGELDTRDVEPTAHAVPLPTKLRPDDARPGLPVDVGLRGAPEPLNGGFGVPKIIE